MVGIPVSVPACQVRFCKPKIRQSRPAYLRHLLAAPMLAAAIASALPAAGQARTSGDRILQREQRIRDLDQFNLDTRLRANTEVPVDQRVFIDYGAFITFSYLSVDDSQEENHVLRQTDFNVFARANLDNAQELFLRGRTGWRDFNEGDSFDGRGDENIDGDLDRGYYRIDFARLAQSQGKEPANIALTFQGGRDLVYWANGLVLGQVLDGVKLNFASGPIDAEIIAGVTPTRTVDIDASRPSFDYNTRRGFYGGMLAANASNHRPYAYFLSQIDYNENDEANIGSINTEFDYNSYYIGLGSQGALTDRLSYGIEAAYQGGEGLSNSFRVNGQFLEQINQTEEEIQAWALNARLDYAIPDPYRTRLALEQTIASGDRDRGNSSETFNGNAAGTKDRAFNAFGLINSGLAYAPNLSNISITRLGASTYPFGETGVFRRLQFGADLLFFAKVETEAAVDERSSDDRFLGIEPDLYLTWQATSDLTFVLRYGIFFPGDALLSNDEVRQFIYGGVTFSF